jgi:hypothetical protein
MNVNRPVVLYIGPEGTVIHDRDALINFPADQRPKPFASVETEKDAAALTVLLCQSQPLSHPRMPGKPWYTYRPFDGSFEAQQKAANDFEAYYGAMLERRAKVGAAA